VVYNVHPMKHLKVAEARARFGEILDEAEKGATVIIERRDVRFRLVAERQRPSAASKTALFDFVDPSVMTGQWSWRAGSKGVTFAPRRKRR
jgi:antitoxin (DNA-binding transcriptional repressor) of toxin-antitoxin stability system